MRGQTLFKILPQFPAIRVPGPLNNSCMKNQMRRDVKPGINQKRIHLAGAMLLGILTICFSTYASSQSAQGSLPGVQFGQTALLSPATAETYYSSQPATVTYAWSSSRPPEVTELAVALGNNPDRMFAYVRNNIHIVPIYGMQKGAVGALVDRSGTAFDQAQLLVELLRAANFTSARYVLGDLTLTGQQLNDWLGVSSVTAATSLLANGGIPAQVSGSGQVTNVTLGHVWVQVEVNGITRTYDPSYKPHDVGLTIDAKSVAGFSRSSFVSNAVSGASLLTENGVPYIRSVNLSGLESSLTSSAMTLLGQLRTTYAARAADDLTGARRIQFSPAPEANPTTGTLSSRQVFTGGVPDKYRVKFSVVAGNCNRSFFIDEIYGRRLTFHREIGFGSPINGIYVDDNLAGASCGSANDTSLQSVPITLTVDHPYAASNGSYMDTTSIKYVDRTTDIVIVHGWGDTGSALQSKLALEAATERDEKIPDPVEGDTPDGSVYTQADAGDTQVSVKSKLAASWLAQSTRTAKLLRTISGVEFQHHHTIGVAYAQSHYFVYDTNKNRIADPSEIMIQDDPQDSGLRLDLDSGFSSVSLNADAADQLAARHTLAAAVAMLESSVMKQQLDAVDTASTAERLPWAQENLTTSVRYHFFAPNVSPAVVTNYRSGASPSTTLGCEGASVAAQGFNVLQVNDRSIGPGEANPVPTVWSTIKPYVPQTDATMHRGCAWIAFKSDGSHIAHLVTSLDRGLKGGGAGADAKMNEAFKPEKQADLLKDQFKDRSSVNGVDSRTGAFTYTPAADLKIGQGEFPNSLSFQRSFQAGGTRCAGCPFGWTHNFDLRAAASGGGLEGMGSTSPLTLAGPLIALEGAFALYRDNPNAAANQVAGAAVMRWFDKHLSNNVVTVTLGQSSETFVRLADNTFVAAQGGGSQLTQTGTRRAILETAARSETWKYDQVSFVRKSKTGDQIAFAWREWNPSSGEFDYPKSKAFGFLASSWTFPKGVGVTFTYCESRPMHPRQEVSYCRDRLERVSNNLGLHIDVDRLNATSSDGRTTTMAIAVTQPNTPEWEAIQPTSLTDSEGRVWRFDWRRAGPGDRPSPYPYLSKVYSPQYIGEPQVQLTYNKLNQVKEYRDRLAVMGQRGAWTFMPANYGYGRTVDPLGGVVSITYNEDDLAIIQTDELGRSTTTTYDGRKRVASRTYPEGDKAIFAYDDRDNVIELRKVAKPGLTPAPADIVVTAAWHTIWNKPLWIKDALNNQTDYTYYASGAGAGEIQQVLQPAVDGGRPLWAFEYTSKGLVSKTTDTLGLITSFSYNTNGYLTSKIQDPSGLAVKADYENNTIGDVISVDGPFAGTDDKTFTTYDVMRRPEYEIGADPDGPSAPLKRAITKHHYDNDGREYRTDTGTGNATDGSDFDPSQYKVMTFDAVGNVIKTEVFSK